ncbi:MAG TPA: HNH endonuclease domain-containing protein [Paludibacter sp.]|nr:HNH endonuclease domain-containing protein [Paludibacter sp.]
MKRILGLDLGTNSIGWALVDVELYRILGIGSRIIPMSQDILGKFDSGNSISQTAERTGYRGIRRIRERHLLRRERIHRVLYTMGFLPKHYEKHIDFEKHFGKFLTDSEPKLAWKENENGKFEFIFKASFYEMVEEFKQTQPHLFDDNNLIPYDWTIYYLRKKALYQKIEKEELAWLLLNFNQKRGYYQLRGEEEEDNPNKLVEFHSLNVIDVTADEAQKGKAEIWYNVGLENGWIYRRASKNPLFDWIGKTKEFIVTTDLNDDGSVKTDKDGKEKRSFRAPSEDDWTLLKKKTESDIENSMKTVGTYIYDTLLKNPTQKINGKLVRTIERKFYRDELKQILSKQTEFHAELQNNALLNSCIEELYPYNEAHRNILTSNDFVKLFVDDIIFYQRPLKSKKSLISNCKFEYRTYKDTEGVVQKEPIKCVPKSHPLYQELRLWKFVKDLRIYEREKTIDGKFYTDYNVTNDFIKSEEDLVELFDWLNDRKEIKQDTLLSSFFKIKKRKKGDEKLPYRWNYVEDKEYPCNETHAQIINRLAKIKDVTADFLTKEKEMELWHILYSVSDKNEIEKALKTFGRKNKLSNEFVEVFKKFPPFKSEYGSYSEKALKKLLPLMRMGKYWNYNAISDKTRDRIDKLLTAEFDESIQNQVREKAIQLTTTNDFKGLPEWLASYIVYNRHSEASEYTKWKTHHDLDEYLKEFKQHSLRNPIVEQVITETLRVVRDIWKKYGEIAEIHVELGREMKNPADKRAAMTKQISENENTNLRIKALLAELANDANVENVRPYSPSQQEILKIYEDGVLKSGIEIDDDISKISKLAQPSKSELIRYKLWLEQKYRSPYTGEMIPLGKLFTSAYQIEHIIPQSRYFDDSLSNKVICESVVNGNPYKDNQLGYEFVSKNEGRIVPELSTAHKTVKIFNLNEYETFVKQHYGKNSGKMKKLLMEDIPEAFIERQLNDTRYISKVVKGLLSNIVREEDETEPTSKNVIPTNGSITDTLKKDWGLNDVWNKIITPRFERMNALTNSNLFGQWTNKEGKNVFQTEVPLELQKGFNKKRIDHRHHAMDALVIACATRSHVNYLNNESAKAKAKESRQDLKTKLCFKSKTDNNGNYKWQFVKPWSTFTEDAQQALENIIVSFKQNLRVINKTVNKFESYKDENGKLQLDKNGNPSKIIRKQTNGDSWAIRKPLHKETVAGQVNLRFKKQVALSAAINQWEMLVDKNLKTKIKRLINEGLDKKKIQKFFADKENTWQGMDISKPEVYYFSNEKEILVASRTALNESFNSKTIESITDHGIQKILKNHLSKYNEEKEGKTIEHPELAFSAEGIDNMNKSIKELNGGRFHQSITKVRCYEPKGNKFNVGTTGNKKDKFVVAATGTNLYFAIYVDGEGKRSYETIALNTVIDRLKKGESPIIEEMWTENQTHLQLQFFLNPNDLVYIPTPDQIANNNKIMVEDLDISRIYKFVDSSDTTANFTPATSASLIFNLNKKEQEKRGLSFAIQNEFGIGSPQSKNQKALTGEMIKEVCLKLYIDRLGNISFHNPKISKTSVYETAVKEALGIEKILEK